MTEQNNTQGNAQAENATNAFAIQRIYVKDVSFETPNVPQVFTTEWKPEMNVEMNTSSQVVAEGVYEVALRVTVTTKTGDMVAYICEVTQAGIFSIVGFSDQQLQHCLGAFCPNILFPYVRETVSSLVNKGTFLPFNLEPVNFDAVFMNYMQQQAQQQSQQAGNDETAATENSSNTLQ